MDGVEVLLAELAARLFERAALVSVRLVRDPRPEHAVRDRLPVDGRRECRLELARPRFLSLRQVAEIPAAGELPELLRAAVGLGGPGEAERRVERRQVGIALVDR